MQAALKAGSGHILGMRFDGSEGVQQLKAHTLLMSFPGGRWSLPATSDLGHMPIPSHFGQGVGPVTATEVRAASQSKPIPVWLCFLCSVPSPPLLYWFTCNPQCVSPVLYPRPASLLSYVITKAKSCSPSSLGS